MHDLKATCADRDSKKGHLGILKELSLSKTRNFERDRSFSFDLFFFFLWKKKKTKQSKKQNKTKKQGYCIYAKQKGRDIVLYITWLYHAMGCMKGRAS